MNTKNYQSEQNIKIFKTNILSKLNVINRQIVNFYSIKSNNKLNIIDYEYEYQNIIFIQYSEKNNYNKQLNNKFYKNCYDNIDYNFDKNNNNFDKNNKNTNNNKKKIQIIIKIQIIMRIQIIK